MAKEKTSSIAFEADVSQFTQSINKMRDDIKLINSSFEASASEMDDWGNSSKGIELKISSLNKVLEDEKQKLSDMESRRKEYISTLDKNKKKLAELEAKYKSVVDAEGESSENAKKLAKQKATLTVAIAKNERAITDESVAINKQKTTINNTNKTLKSYEDALENVGKEAKDSGTKVKGFGDSSSKLKGALSGIGKGVAAGIAAIGAAAVAATASFLALAESTREYRREMGLLKTVSDTANANFEETKKTYQDLVALTNDEGAATEAINNLLTAGFKGDELDQVTQYIQGAAIQWKDTLKAEGLSDSIQEWIGSGGESLTGQMAEMLERLGYNLETVKAETAGMTEEQRRAYLMNIMASEGLGEISAKYKEQNKELYEASLAQQNLTDKMAELGKIAEPITTILKNGLAAVLEYITPWVNRLGNAFELLLSKGNAMTGLQRLGDIFLDIKEKASEMLVGLIDGLAEFIPQFLPKVAEFLGQVVQQFVEFIPTLTDAAIQLFMAIAEALPPTIIALLDQLPQILDAIVNSLNEMIPELLDNTIQFLGTILDALPIVIEKLVEILPQLIQTISEFIQENLPVILDAFITLLHTIIDALPIIIEALIEALPTIIDTIIQFVTDNLPIILDGGLKLFMEIVNAIPLMIEALIEQLPTIIDTIVEALTDNFPLIMETAFEMFMQIVKSIPDMIINLGTSLEDIRTTIVETLEDIDLFKVGQDIIQGLIDGIEDIGGNIWGTVTDIGDNIVSGFKNFFGIHSPSKLMKDKIGSFLGEGLALGIGEGFDKDIDKIKKGIVDNLDFDDEYIDDEEGYGKNKKTRGATKNVTLNYTVNSPTPLSRRELYNQAKKAKTLLGGVS
jgi:phage-related protein